MAQAIGTPSAVSYRGNSTGSTSSGSSVYSYSGAVTGSNHGFSISFSGVPAGAYTVLVYTGTYNRQMLLAQGTLTVGSTTQASMPTCTLAASPQTATFGQNVTLSWTSKNATSASWQTSTGGKDNIAPPTSVPNLNGTATVVANVYGSPYVQLNVSGPAGNFSCAVTLLVPSTSSNPAPAITSTGVTVSYSPWEGWIDAYNINSGDVVKLTDTSGQQWGSNLPVTLSSDKTWLAFQFPSDTPPSQCNLAGPCTIQVTIVAPDGTVSNTSTIVLPRVPSAALPVTPTATSATVTVSQSSVAAGTSAWVAITNPNPNSGEWIALFRQGDQPTQANATNGEFTWAYLNSCTKNRGSSNVGSGSCSLAIPSTLPAGSYYIELFGDSTYNQPLAQTTALTVTNSSTSPTPSSPVSVSPSTINTGTSVSVSWSVSQVSDPNAWLALTPQGSSPAQSSVQLGGWTWFYLSSCSKTAGSSATPTGSCSITIPTSIAPGTYMFQLFGDNTYGNPLTQSGPVFVTGSSGSGNTSSMYSAIQAMLLQMQTNLAHPSH